MPRVPLLDPQVKFQTVQVPGPAPMPQPTPDIFGGKTAQANERIGETISQAGALLAQHAIRMQDRENDKAVLQNQTDFQKELQDHLFSGETDSDGKPKGIMNRSLGQAKGSTMEFDQTYSKLREKYLGQVSTPQQKMKLNASLNAHYDAARNQVISHEAQQGDADYKNVLNTNVQQNIDEASTISNPDSLRLSIDVAAKSLGDGYAHLGMDKDSIGNAQRELAGKMTAAAVTANLSRDPATARKLLDAHRDIIPGATAAQLDEAILGKEVHDTQLSVWNQVKDFRLSDGNVDMDKAQKTIMGMNVPADRKEQILSFVHSMASTQDSNLRQSRAAADRDFLNKLYTFKQQGGGLADAIKLSATGFDPADRALKAEAIKKLYTNPQETNPVAYVALWDRVQANQATKTDLVAELGKGSISSSDFEGLWKELARVQLEGPSPADKAMRDRIKMLAQAKFGTSPEEGGLKKADEFMYTVQKMGQGKSPEEQWKIANELLKDVPSGHWYKSDKPAWNVEFQRLDAQNAAWGQVKADLGQDVVGAIGRSSLSGGKDSWGLPDVQMFVNDLGGPEAVKVGSPANNAAKSLIKHGRMVTSDAIKKVLSVYKDGNF